MDHGRLAYVSSQQIRLHEDILRPLTISAGSTVFGLYYPKRSGEGADVQHDLMLTPVPYESWPVSAAFTLFLKHVPGTFATIATYLASISVNIIAAQCIRIGHHHSAWHLVVEFESHKPGEFSQYSAFRYNRLVSQVQAQVKKLTKGIEKNCGDALQLEQPSFYRKAVRGWPLKALAFFYDHVESERTRSVDPRVDGVCKDGHTVTFDNPKKFELSSLNKVATSFPTISFASLDSEASLIRVALLQKERLDRFRRLTVKYSLARTEPDTTSRGLLKNLSRCMADRNWNIWSLFDQTQESNPNYESGSVNLFAEYLSDDGPDHEGISELKYELRTSPGAPEASITTVSIAKASPSRIFLSIKNKEAFPSHDRIVELCGKLASQIGILPGDIIVVYSGTPESLMREVSSKISECDGFLQYFGVPIDIDSGQRGSPSTEAELMTASSVWLNAEFFLASYLGIPSVRIVEDSMQPYVAFEQDRHVQNVPDGTSHNPEALTEVLTKTLLDLDRSMKHRARADVAYPLYINQS